MKILWAKFSVFMIAYIFFTNQTIYGLDPVICIRDEIGIIRYLASLRGGIPLDMQCDPIQLNYIATFAPVPAPAPLLPSTPSPPPAPLAPPAPTLHVRPGSLPEINFSSFLSNRFDSRCGLSSTRISIASGDSPNRNTFAPLCYLIEFSEESIDKVPESIMMALAKFYDIDLRENLYRELKKRRVENIFISACGFGPIPNARTPEMTTAEFRIIPQPFMAHQFAPLMDNTFDGEVFIGIFEDNGTIQPIGGIRSLEDSVLLLGDEERSVLVPQVLAFNKPQNKFLPDSVLKYRLSNPEGLGSFYVLAITPDRRNILITQVLLINNRADAEQIFGLFVSAPNFIGLLPQLTHYASSCPPPAEDALDNTIDSLERLTQEIAWVPMIWGRYLLSPLETVYGQKGVGGYTEFSHLTFKRKLYRAVRIHTASDSESFIRWTLSPARFRGKIIELSVLAKTEGRAVPESITIRAQDNYGHCAVCDCYTGDTTIVSSSVRIPVDMHSEFLHFTFSNNNTDSGVHVDFANIKVKALN